MSRRLYCRVCGCELIGSIGNVFVDSDIYTYLITRGSPDCNWRRCRGCGDVLCKNCYVGQSKYCCEEDRIVCRERVQTIVDLGQ